MKSLVFLLLIASVLSGCSVKTIEIEHYVFEGYKEWKDFKLPLMKPRNIEIESSLTHVLDSVVIMNTKKDYTPTNYILEYETGEEEGSFLVSDCTFNLLMDRTLEYKGVYVFEKNDTQMYLFILNRGNAMENPLFENIHDNIRFSVSNYPLRKDAQVLYFHAPKQLKGIIRDNHFVIDSVR